MNKSTEKILFDTIERAIEYGSDRSRYGEFEFRELYELIQSLEDRGRRIKVKENKISSLERKLETALRIHKYWKKKSIW